MHSRMHSQTLRDEQKQQQQLHRRSGLSKGKEEKKFIFFLFISFCCGGFYFFSLSQGAEDPLVESGPVDDGAGLEHGELGAGPPLLGLHVDDGGLPGQDGVDGVRGRR